ncbi:heme-binding protein [Cryobacterium sp. SO2]|uniref:SOUL family heme-binding protein n=1 Tax=Cryobacterium sp. SO2 TaxID=1897060 RepID=UPI00223D768C|nr:heme-binding protein [Cryobacterium sp. SO2]WEO75769.1 heme-binding protein [Cryobacterium sp. SO2]
MNEHLPYTVVRAFPRFDVRRYPDCVLVQVRVDTDFARAAPAGARSLYRYLNGGNQAATAFGVTAPVLQEPAGESEQLLSLVLPVDTDLAAVPRPLDDSVQIRSVPAHEAAALRFSGGWASRRFMERGRELLADVRAFRLEPLGPVYFARLDPFWKPGFLSHNEALVRVTSA